MGSQWGARSGQGRMSTRYQRQHVLEGINSSYSREVRSASCGPPSDRLYSPSSTRCSYMGGVQTKSGMDLSNMYRYHSSAPVRLRPPTIPKPLPLTQQLQSQQ